MDTSPAPESYKPRIALMTYAIDNRPAKGTAVVARKCVEELLTMRDRFELTFIHYEKCDDPIYSHGVREVLLPTFGWKLLNKRSLRQIYYFFTTKDRFDIVQWFQPRLYPFFWKVPADNIVVEVHGAGDVAPEAPFDIMRLVFNWSVKTFIRRIDAAIVSSEFAKRDIIKYYGFAPEQVRIIYNGVDASFVPAPKDAIARVREKYELPAQFFVGVGRLNPNKNVYRVLQAFDAFCAAHPDSAIHFVNIGAQGTDRPLIDELLRTSPHSNRMHLVPYVEVEDLPMVYSAAFGLVFPLLNEGFGLPMLEAMACGIPTVVANTAYPEIQPEEAILVDAADVQSIAAGIEELWANAAKRESITRLGHEKSRQYTWMKTGKELSALFEELHARTH